MTAHSTALTWSADLDDAAIAAVRDLLDAATESDGTAPVGEQVILELRSGSSAVHLLARDGSRLVGYAQLDEGTAELAVHPEHRRLGVGAALVEALLARAVPLRIWAHGEHPGALALADRFGFRRARELWQLRRDLLDPPLATPEFPGGVSVRGFLVGRDEPEFLRVNSAAFGGWHPEQGGLTAEDLTLRETQPWFDPDGFLLATEPGEDGERLLGFHWTKVHPGPPPIGEVYVLGVDPAAQGRKLGAALTLAGLHHLRKRGLDAVMLYVESDNRPAVRVYTDLGFTRAHTDVLFERAAR